MSFAGNGHDVARARGIDRGALKTLRTQQFGDAEVLDGAVHTGQTVGLALSRGCRCRYAPSRVDPGNRRNRCWRRVPAKARLPRIPEPECFDDGFEQRFEIFVIRQTAILRLVFGSVAGLGRAVDDRQVEQRILIEIDTLR